MNVKKTTLILIISLVIYITVTNNILVTKFNDVEYKKTLVNLSYERQVLILEKQSYILNDYIDYVTEIEIKSKIMLMKEHLEYIKNNKQYAVEYYNKYYSYVFEEINKLSIHSSIAPLLEDYISEVVGSEYRINVAKRDYSKSLAEYNTCIKNPVFLLMATYLKLEEKDNVYMFVERDVEVRLFEKKYLYADFFDNDKH